jgi:SMC interacting uncharacterized protein involved in chromosome segregation
MAQKEEIKKIIECLELITKRIKKIEKDVLRLHKQNQQYKDTIEEKRIDEGGWRS